MSGEGRRIVGSFSATQTNKLYKIYLIKQGISKAVIFYLLTYMGLKINLSGPEINNLSIKHVPLLSSLLFGGQWILYNFKGLQFLNDESYSLKTGLLKIVCSSCK